MKYKIFVVFDGKTKSWGLPFLKDFTANALREWSEIASDLSDKQNQIAKYPSDFSLFEIGEYNRDTGEVSMYESKFNLGLASEHVKQN
ncbi:MAG: nonstructural protein [Arizlama microvirus]|nr:MAG: nonstructural protein [Arizlama microvirus]